MTTTSFMPNNDSGKADLLAHLATTLPNYAVLLDVSDEDLSVLKADSIGSRYVLQALNAAQAHAKHWTALKNQLRDGTAGTASWPALPVLSESIPPVISPGIIPRLSALVARLKTHKNYTTAIGQDLWLIGSTQIIDPGTWKPALGMQNKAGHPVIVWTKGKAAALEIWVDRGDSNNFVFLTINTEPNTNDTCLLPEISSIWKYKAIYRLHDEQVGQWSDVISVSVGG
jgi:hypothetical protein